MDAVRHGDWASEAPAKAVSLGISTWVDRGAAVAELAGELDFYATRELGALLANVQHVAPRPGLLLILDRLMFIDSGGLGAVITARKRAEMRGGGIALVGVPEHFAKIVRVCGLSDYLPSFATVEEAWAHLAKVAP